MIARIFEGLFGLSPDLFSKGKLVFTSPLPSEVRLLLFIAGAALIVFLYRKVVSSLSKKIRMILLGLRLAMLLVLALLLGAPALRVRSSNTEGMFTAVLVDNSASMTLEDVEVKGRTVSRLEVAREAAFGGEASAGLIQTLGEVGQVITYGFSETPKRLQRAAQLDGRGVATGLFRAIHDVDAELQSVPLSSVIMVTDGCRNVGGSATDAAAILAARGVPLFILGLGNATPPADLEVVQVLAPERVRSNSSVELDITVRHTGFKEPFDVRLERDGIAILTQPAIPMPNSDVLRMRMTFTPDHDGAAVYRISIPAAEGENYAQNNAQEFNLTVQDDRLPVLYIEGSPRIEYRYLRRALARDPDFRLVGVLRLAENRFFIQGSNDSEAFLKDGFPKTADQLFRFQAIILGDIEASVFTPEQMTLFEEFVKTRGGGLLMLGGVNAFGLGKYADTPVGRMLPVTISPNDPPYSDEEFLARPEEVNLEHPVMKLALDPLENANIWDAAPPLVGITPVSGIKPGASLLLKSATPEARPVLAVQQYGNGRVAAFTSGGSWYWRMSLNVGNEFQERFWKQLIRWLVVGVKEQLTVQTDADIYARHDPVSVRALVLANDLVPINDAKVWVTITDPIGNSQELPMDWILSEEGVYQCRYIPEEEGAYRLAVRVEGWDSKPLEKGFMVNPPVIEFADAGLKREVLKQMAAATHGAYYEIDELPRMLREVKERARESAVLRTTPEDHPLWDMPLLFVIGLGLMGAEWLLRRRAGLA